MTDDSESLCKGPGRGIAGEVQESGQLERIEQLKRQLNAVRKRESALQQAEVLAADQQNLGDLTQAVTDRCRQTSGGVQAIDGKREVAESGRSDVHPPSSACTDASTRARPCDARKEAGVDKTPLVSKTLGIPRGSIQGTFHASEGLQKTKGVHRH